MFTKHPAPVLLVVAWLNAGQAAADATDAPPPRPQPYRDQIHVRALPRTAAEVEQIWALSEHVLAPHDPELVPHELAITPATLRALRARGIDARADAVDVEALAESWTRDALRARADGRYLHAGELDIYDDWFGKVQNLEAITARLRELEGLAQGRAQVISIGKSVQSRDILAIRIGAAPRGSDRASIIVIGTQHPREWASPMVTMGIADALVRQYEADARVRRIVDGLETIIVPVANPDGYVATFNGRRLQRKNMNPTCGIDLNRNYDAAFGAGAGNDRCGGETYAGPSAFSEPESRAVRDLVQSLPRARLLIDYHSTAAQVMIPYAYTTMRPPNYEKNKAWCELYATTLAGLNGTRHPARDGFLLARGQGGGAFDWFRMRHSESIVVELGGGPAFSIAAAAIIPAAEENFVAWLAVAAKVADENGVPGAPTPPPPADAAAPVDGPAAPDTALPDAAPPLPGAPVIVDAAAPPPTPDAATPPAPAPPTPTPTPPGTPAAPPGASSLDGGGFGCGVAGPGSAPPLAVATLALFGWLVLRRRA